VRPFWILHVWLLAAFGLWAGCDALSFSPSPEIPFTEVDPTPGTLTLELTTSSDTLGLWGNATLTYDLDTLGTGPVDSVRVQIGDHTTTLPPGRPFTLATTDLSDGVYPFRLTAYASSGTGSIADAYGREQVVAEIARVAAIDNAPPQPVAVRAVEPEDGMLRIRWEQYPRFNFQAYRVLRETSAGGERRIVSTISDRDVTSWSDPQFIGGTARYLIEVVAGDGRRADGPVLERAFPVPVLLNAEINSEGQAQVQWSGTRFPGALGRYEVIEPGSSFNVRTLYATTQDTTASFSVTPNGEMPAFGALYSLAVQTWSQPEAGGGTNSGTRLRTQTVETSFDPESGFIHPESGSARAVFALPDQDAVYGVDATTRQPAIRDAATLEVRAQASLPADAFVWYTLASPSGRPAVIYSRLGRYYGALLNPTTLAIEQSVALEPFLGAGAVPDVGEFGFPALTNDGVLFYGANPSSSDYVGPTVVGVDLVAGERVATFGEGGTGALGVLDVSEDGGYVLLNVGAPDQLFERDPTDPSGYRPISGLQDRLLDEVLGGPPHDAAFVGPSQLAILVGGFGTDTIQTLDLPSLSVLKTFEVPGGSDGSVSYDPVSDRLASVTDATLYLTRPTGTSAPVTLPTAVSAHRLSYAAGALWGNGRIRRIF